MTNKLCFLNVRYAVNNFPLVGFNTENVFYPDGVLMFFGKKCYGV